MTTYHVLPLDPLIFGTGQPFSSIPGAQLRSAVLPPPSTVAGMIRTESGRDAQGRFDTKRIADVLNIGIRGPFLTITSTGELALPAPADALRLEADKADHHRLVRLAPIELKIGEAVSAVHGGDLAPIGMHPHRPDKPARGVPAFWRYAQLLEWLRAPWTALDPQSIPSSYGVAAPPAEPRTHVAISPDGTARSGALFATQGHRFMAKVDGELSDLALTVDVVDATSAAAGLGDRPVVLGGEGRLSRLKATGAPLPFGEPPTEVVESARRGAVRVYFATPACFDDGSAWQPPAPATVVAAAHGRAQVISGWEMTPSSEGAPATRYAKSREAPAGGRPKAIRRLVPAGAVFFLRLSSPNDPDYNPDANEAFVRSHWGRSILQGADARDGFAIALFGTWDGKLRPLTLSQT